MNWEIWIDIYKYPKGDQSWVFFGRTDAKTNSSTLATLCEELTHWKRL